MEKDLPDEAIVVRAGVNASAAVLTRQAARGFVVKKLGQTALSCAGRVKAEGETDEDVVDDLVQWLQRHVEFESYIVTTAGFIYGCGLGIRATGPPHHSILLGTVVDGEAVEQFIQGVQPPRKTA